MRSIFSILALLLVGLSLPATGQTLATLAKQQGCTSTPVVVQGTDLYKCKTEGAMSFFNVPGSAGNAPPRKNPLTSGGRTATPANFPRVDGVMQRERDDVRKRVLKEELATEARLLAESESGLKSGSAPLADESYTSPKYLDRQAKLRQTVDHHTKNVQALNKELDRLR